MKYIGTLDEQCAHFLVLQLVVCILTATRKSTHYSSPTLQRRESLLCTIRRPQKYRGINLSANLDQTVSRDVMQRSVRHHSRSPLVWGVRVSVTVRVRFLLLAFKEEAANVFFPALRRCHSNKHVQCLPQCHCSVGPTEVTSASCYMK